MNLLALKRNKFLFLSYLACFASLLLLSFSSYIQADSTLYSSRQAEEKAEKKNNYRQELENYLQHFCPSTQGDLKCKIKQDKSGRFWILEETAGKSFRLTCLNSNQQKYKGLSEKPAVSSLAHSFDFSLGPAEEIWLAWVETSSQEDRLKIFSSCDEEPLTVAVAPAFSLTSPAITTDGCGATWVFWAEPRQGIDQICFRRFYGNSFPDQKEILFNNDYPSILPTAQIDNLGRLWLAWAEYDGRDYEIFLASYDGARWSAPQRITSNEQADLFPALTLTPDGLLFLSWIEAGRKECRLWSRKINDFFLDKPEIMYSSSLPPSSFSLLKDNEGFFLLSKEERGFRFCPLSGLRVQKNYPDHENFLKQDFSFLLQPGRNDDVYLAFGDSITSGLIKTKLDPEEYYYYGYPPRLELLLQQDYGYARVINEGKDGEITAQGLSRLPAILKEYNARYLLLMEGFNDVIFANISLDTTIFNLSEMVRRSLAEGVFPAIATITPRRDSVWYNPFFQQRHLSLNERIRKLAPQLLIPLVDQYQAFTNYPASEGGLLSLLSVDLKHPNEKGYQLMASTWQNEIQAFPFPPQNLTLARRDFVWENRFTPLFMFLMPATASNTANQGTGNFLTWTKNTKIKRDGYLAGYRVYRKTEADASYTLIATIKEKLHYFDKPAILNTSYAYLVSCFRTDGVEGPASGPVTR